GLECQQVTHEVRRVAEVLRRVGREYSFPFGDFSTISTNILVHQSLALAQDSRTVIEGTGADGAFGVGVAYPIWRRVYEVPSLLRRPADAAYSLLKLWRRHSDLERLARASRNSRRMPLGHAFVAENALEGIGYHIPEAIRAELERAIRCSMEV